MVQMQSANLALLWGLPRPTCTPGGNLSLPLSVASQTSQTAHADVGVAPRRESPQATGGSENLPRGLPSQLISLLFLQAFSLVLLDLPFPWGCTATAEKQGLSSKTLVSHLLCGGSPRPCHQVLCWVPLNSSCFGVSHHHVLTTRTGPRCGGFLRPYFTGAC